MGKGTAGKNADLYTTGTSTSMTDEACTENSGTEFQVTASAKRILDTSVAVVVKVDTVVQSSGYSVDYNFGKVTFDTSQTGSTVTITASYLPRHNLAKIYDASISDSWDTVDTTCFQDDAQDTTLTIRRASISFSTYDLLDTVYDGGTEDLNNTFANGDLKVFELQETGSGNSVTRVRSYLTGKDVSTDAQGVVTVDLGTVGSGDGNTLISRGTV